MKLTKINNSKNIITKSGKNMSAFTLIEVMVGILIVSIVMIGGFKSLTAITVGKAKLIQKTDIQKESFYFTEKLFEMIKKGGTIDYEEYFNRKAIGDKTFGSGHFLVESGFGNFGSGGVVGTSTFGDYFYRCRSGVGVGNQMQGEGCLKNDLNEYGSNVLGEQQRYGEYSFQFIDYNSNYDNDGIKLGDEDGDGEIIGDDDDEYLGDGPIVFTGGVDLTELYLISGNKKERTLFRWNVKKDPDSPYGCTLDNTNTITGSGCIGNVEYLKLEGKDLGMDHSSSGSSTYLDGVIDTWIIDKNLSSGVSVVAGSNSENYRVPLFSDSINVSEFKVYAYPNKDITNAWKNSDPEVNISPYVFLKVTLKPSWITRKEIRGEGEELDFSMTINLSEIYSQ